MKLTRQTNMENTSLNEILNSVLDDILEESETSCASSVSTKGEYIIIVHALQGYNMFIPIEQYEKCCKCPDLEKCGIIIPDLFQYHGEIPEKILELRNIKTH